MLFNAIQRQLVYHMETAPSAGLGQFLAHPTWSDDLHQQVVRKVVMVQLQQDGAHPNLPTLARGLSQESHWRPVFERAQGEYRRQADRLTRSGAPEAEQERLAGAFHQISGLVMVPHHLDRLVNQGETAKPFLLATAAHFRGTTQQRFHQLAHEGVPLVRDLQDELHLRSSFPEATWTRPRSPLRL